MIDLHVNVLRWTTKMNGNLGRWPSQLSKKKEPLNKNQRPQSPIIVLPNFSFVQFKANKLCSFS